MRNDGNWIHESKICPLNFLHTVKKQNLMELFKEYTVHLNVDSELRNKSAIIDINDKTGSDEIITNHAKS